MSVLKAKILLYLLTIFTISNLFDWRFLLSINIYCHVLIKNL